MSEILAATGFFSSAREDDRNAGGRLSQLRGLLAGELRTPLGRVILSPTYPDNHPASSRQTRSIR